MRFDFVTHVTSKTGNMLLKAKEDKYKASKQHEFLISNHDQELCYMKKNIQNTTRERNIET